MSPLEMPLERLVPKSEVRELATSWAYYSPGGKVDGLVRAPLEVVGDRAREVQMAREVVSTLGLPSDTMVRVPLVGLWLSSETLRADA